MRFNIGDRVMFVDEFGVIEYGKTGTIVDISEDLVYPYLVEFDEYVNGHDGNGVSEIKTKDGHGWYVDDFEIEMLDEEENDLEFNIGDRVVIEGKTGTVVDILEDTREPYFIEFDEYINGHNGNGHSEVEVEDGYGWYVNANDMELLNDVELLDDNEKHKSIFSDICKRLGVKLDEVWVASNGYKYRISETGIYFYRNDTREWHEIFAPDYRDIIKGKLYPTKTWVPEVGELVYLISPELHTGTRQILYNGSVEHERLYERGFIHKDEEQARSVIGIIVEEIGR